MDSGNAALRREARNISRRRGLWRLALLLVLLGIFVSYVSPVLGFLEKTELIGNEMAVTEELRLQQEQLLKERERLTDDRYVEQVARRDLGLVRPGEQPFVIKDLDAAGAAPEPAQEPSAQEDDSLWRTVSGWIESLSP